MGGKSGSYTQPAGQTTSTSTSAPWEPQQDYLKQGFASAQNLYNSGGPQYYPGATYAPETSAQTQGWAGLQNQGIQLTDNLHYPLNSLYQIENGNYLNANPAQSGQQLLGGTNPATNSAGYNPLVGLAQGSGPAGFNTSSPYASLLGLGQSNAAYLNPAYGNLASTAAGNVGTGGALGALGGVADGGLGLAPSRGVLQGNAQNGTNLSQSSSALADVANGGLGLAQSRGTFEDIANGGLGLAPAKGTFQNLAANGAGVQAPQSALSSIFNANPADLAGASGTDYLNRLLTPGNGNFVNNAGNIGGQALGGFASGSHTNPYLDQLTEATRAAVLPGIQSQFINGGGLSSPGAAYASSQGVGAALAPVLNQAYQQQEQNQLNAAGQYANLYNQGIGLKTNAASTLAGIEQGNIGQQINAAGQFGNLALGNAGVQNQAAQNFANTQLNKYGLQNSAAQNLANTQLSKYGLQANSANMLGNLGLQNTAQQNAAASSLGNLQLGKAGAITNAASNMGNLALGGTNAATTAGTNLGNQILGGSGQQATDLSSALSSALGFGGLQQNAASNAVNAATAGQNSQISALQGLSSTYGKSLDQMLASIQLYPSLAQSALIGPQAQYQAGQYQQQNQQAAINDQIQRYNFSQTQPYNNLNQFLGQISGNFGGTGSVSQPYYLNQGANTASNVLGAGLGAATGVGAVNSAFPAFLPWIGGILGSI